MRPWRRLYIHLAGPERKRRTVLKRIEKMEPRDLDRVLWNEGGLGGALYSLVGSARGKRERISRAIRRMDEDELNRVILRRPKV
ncbi:MAG: hypothetical protein HY558_00585 [Euryarchaeota archaeon]|nr:hypothetical protein [Euryarchaeota archaeon]